MKSLFLTAAAALVLSAVSASAEVNTFTLRYGGGCTSANVGGTCTFKVHATGTNLGSDHWQLQSSDSQHGNFRFISKRIRNFDSNGNGSIRVPAAKGCYRASTTRNGNDVPDVHSNVKCIE